MGTNQAPSSSFNTGFKPLGKDTRKPTMEQSLAEKTMGKSSSVKRGEAEEPSRQLEHVSRTNSWESHFLTQSVYWKTLKKNDKQMGASPP